MIGKRQGASEDIRKGGLTDLDITTSVQEHIVRLDITMDYVLLVEMCKSFTSLVKQSAPFYSTWIM